MFGDGLKANSALQTFCISRMLCAGARFATRLYIPWAVSMCGCRCGYETTGYSPPPLPCPVFKASRAASGLFTPSRSHPIALHVHNAAMLAGSGVSLRTLSSSFSS